MIHIIIANKKVPPLTKRCIFSLNQLSHKKELNQHINMMGREYKHDTRVRFRESNLKSSGGRT